jgi:hypothetical protein
MFFEISKRDFGGGIAAPKPLLYQPLERQLIGAWGFARQLSETRSLNPSAQTQP